MIFFLVIISVTRLLYYFLWADKGKKKCLRVIFFLSQWQLFDMQLERIIIVKFSCLEMKDTFPL